jgi:cyclic pyranopterin monophosphate synthase
VEDLTRRTRMAREAKAQAGVRASAEALERLRTSNDGGGNALHAARSAALLATKHLGLILPERHVAPIGWAAVEFWFDDGAVRLSVVVRSLHRTGVEIEALAGASAAALALWETLRPYDAACELEPVRLLAPERRAPGRDLEAAPLRAAVLVMSDSIAAGSKHDTSGRLIRERLVAEGVEVVDYLIIPDDEDGIVSALRGYADEARLDLVLTTGGTGFSPRDRTPEAMARVIEREAPGIVEAARAHGQEQTPYAMLSRGRAGVRGDTLIVNLPGSRRGVAESLDALFPWLLHAFKIMRGGGHA